MSLLKLRSGVLRWRSLKSRLCRQAASTLSTTACSPSSSRSLSPSAALSPSALSPSALSLIRNVGVVAHIDAGKTTLTERLLFLAGETRALGDVDSGTTVTDFLDIERERGITINSAAVKLHLESGHRVHLIDTPGHVDFGVEVERCVRVLDGLLVVVDAAAGVQAQTLVVWRQAAKFGLPAVFFVNKMDKPTASFANAVDSIEQKLGVRALPLIVPVSDDKRESPILVDLLQSQSLALAEGDKAKWKSIQTGTREWTALAEHRENALLALSDLDDIMAEEFLQKAAGDADAVPNDVIVDALGRVSLSRTACVAACGSALRAAESVRPCLDLIARFLPSPEAAAKRLEPLIDNEFTGVVFKIAHDPRRGRLSFMRCYSGELRSGAHIFNATRAEKEGPIEVCDVQSDTIQKSATAASAGDVVVLRGLQHALTGDTLLASEEIGRRAAEKLLKEGEEDRDEEEEEDALGVHLHEGCIAFHGIAQPEPVFYCSIEPPSFAGKHALEKALAELAVEDPSLRVREDAETGQTILEAMGELHLEIVKDRLVRGYGLNVFIGPLQVSYREMPTESVEESATVEEELAGRSHSATMTIQLEPLPEDEKPSSRVHVRLPANRRLRIDWTRAVRDGVRSALRHGPLLGLPVHAAKVTVTDYEVSGGRVSSAIICSAAHKAVVACLAASQPALLEPQMEIELEVFGAETQLQPLLHELANRRATVEHVEGERSGGDNGGFVRILGSLPLSSLAGLSRSVRTLSRGMAQLHVRLKGYTTVDQTAQAALIAKRRHG